MYTPCCMRAVMPLNIYVEINISKDTTSHTHIQIHHASTELKWINVKVGRKMATERLLGLKRQDVCDRANAIKLDWEQWCKTTCTLPFNVRKYSQIRRATYFFKNILHLTRSNRGYKKLLFFCNSGKKDNMIFYRRRWWWCFFKMIISAKNRLNFYPFWWGEFVKDQKIL